MESLHQRWLARKSSDTPRILGEPLVSIICFSKNRAATVRRCIESVLGQTYRNIEFVVQDGESTDGTLEILRSYGDPRIKIVSQKDSGPAEGFWKVLHRGEGDIIGTCLSDEELLPDAVARAVDHFRETPHIGALTCDGFVTNPKGKIVNEFNAGEFDFVNYLFGRYCPFWPGSFFRRQALLEVGLKSSQWTVGSLEFEIWCRLGTQHEVRYVPERMSKYAVHEAQLSQTRENFQEHFDNRARVIERLFSRDGFFGENEVLRFGCLYNQLWLLYNHVRAYKLQDQVQALGARLLAMLDGVDPLERLRYRQYFEFLPEDGVKPWDDRSSAKRIKAYQRATALWWHIGLALPPGLRRLLPRKFKDQMRAILYALVAAGYDSRQVLRALRNKFRPIPARQAVAPAIQFSPLVHHEAAKTYYARGQIEQALQHWKRAEVLGDRAIDGLASQAMLMAPSATYESLREMQHRWSERHAKASAATKRPGWRPYDGKRRIRVGYYSVFMDTYVMNVLMTSIIVKRDRNLFEVYGYGPTPVSNAAASNFDRFRVANADSIEKFVQQMRSDEIDILVDVTGLSPHNSLAAKAARCAPIQICYLNHTGTTAVPNVDYVLADPISVPPEHDKYFAEKVWRLPGAFLCYNYDAHPAPPVSAPPYRENDFITFGYFGSGGKLNTQVVELWAEVMKRVPDSLFFMRNGQLSAPDNRQFLQDRFWRFGIAPERLRILEGTDPETILRNYDDVDISLDTWPYCGGNTIAEALWQGVPVVTLMGNRFSGRYGASLLTAAGCPELVAQSADDYIKIASELAHSPSRLDHYRSSLRRMVQANGLSDAEGFARKLEAAYIEMLGRRWSVAGKNPAAH